MIRGIAGKEKYDLIFIDPPYKNKCIHDVLDRLVASDALNDNAIVICESGEEIIFSDDEELKNKFDVQKHARYSITYITVLRLRSKL